MSNTSGRQVRVPKLHEILAVEGDHEGRAKKLVDETVNTFKNKEMLFKGKSRSLVMFGKSESNGTELKAVEDKEFKNDILSSTVPETLNYLATVLKDYYNVVFQKEATNQVAKADLVIGDTVLLTDVPVTFLLSMESRLKDFRRVIEEIPTLEPLIAWVKDENYAKPYVYKSPITHDLKSIKEIDHKVVVNATDKHPAQVHAFDTTKNIGQYSDVQYSGKISSATKAKLLESTDSMIQAVKKARQRANSVDLVEGPNPGGTIFKYILGEFFSPSAANTEAAN